MKNNKIRSLLNQLSEAKAALFSEGVIRSERLTGELGEYLATLQLGGTLATGTSQKGWDLQLGEGEEMKRVQVKAHAKGANNSARWSQFTSIDAFDILFIAVLGPDYRVKELYQVTSTELQEFARKGNNHIWTINWDTLKKNQKEVKPNPSVIDCFGISTTSQEVQPTPPNKGPNEMPDPGHDDEHPWELLTSPTAQQIYFAPSSWREWNVTENNQPGVFNHNRLLVFEYRSPPLPAGNKITLRGLLQLPETLSRKLTDAVEKANWNLPRQGAEPQNTIGYAKWSGNLGGDDVNACVPKFPSNGFDSEQDFFDWLDRWERMIGGTQNRVSKLWDFIDTLS